MMRTKASKPTNTFLKRASSMPHKKMLDISNKYHKKVELEGLNFEMDR